MDYMQYIFLDKTHTAYEADEESLEEPCVHIQNKDMVSNILIYSNFSYI